MLQSQENADRMKQYALQQSGIMPLAIPQPAQLPDFQLPHTPQGQAILQQQQPIVQEQLPTARTSVPMGGPVSDWRSRATPVQVQQPTPQTSAPQGGPVSDWRSRATAVTPPKIELGTDMGRGAAAVQGFNSAVPFGERITSGLGAGMAYGYDQLFGEGDTGIGEFYNAGRENQKVTVKNHEGAYLGGAVAGIAATLPMASAKVIGGGQAATTGVRGAINEIPKMLQGVGNYVRGSKVTEGAGLVAKTANLTGKAIRSASVAAPAAGLYSYGASDNDLGSAGATEDALSGAGMGAMLGVAAPVAGTVINKVGGVVRPTISKATASLAKRAKDFGIDLSLDQLANSRVRDTVQKVSQNLPGSGVEPFTERQRSQWMRAVAKEIGQDTDNLGPETINKFLDESSVKFDNVLKGKTINVNFDPLQKITDIVQNAQSNITDDYARIVVGKADNVTKQLFNSRTTANGVAYAPKTISGEKLASIRSQLIKEMPKVSGDAREYVGDLIEVLDDIAAKNLPQNALDELSTARNQWRNFKTMEPLLEKSTDGTINPTELMSRVASSKYIKASRKELGKDNLVDLAKIGKQFMKLKGGSDTVPNLLIGGGTMGNIGLVAGAPQVAIPAMLAQGTALGANRGYQKLINQNQGAVTKTISKALNNGTTTSTIPSMLVANPTSVGAITQSSQKAMAPVKKAASKTVKKKGK